MPARETQRFDADAFLLSAGFGKGAVTHECKATIFAQGDPAKSVMYIRTGGVQLSVLSRGGKEAILASLRPGEFFGEGAVAGHPVRLETARATAATTVFVIPKRRMARLLQTESRFSDRFIAHMLKRNARLEADLVDQLFNSSERRLARTLLLLARYGATHAKPQRLLPGVSQETLAEMVGTTRPRVNFFLNKFRTLGFIDYDARGLTVNPSLLTVVVHE